MLNAVPDSTGALHAKDDLTEIGRLHMENVNLKAAIPTVAMTVPNGESVTQEVPLTTGEKVMVEVAVHSK